MRVWILETSLWRCGAFKGLSCGGEEGCVLDVSGNARARGKKGVG
jgi:hypothetical protein